MTSYKVAVILFFVLSYTGIIAFSRKKTYFAGVGALILIGLHGLLIAESVSDLLHFIVRTINWNVLGIFLGTLLIADAFIESEVPALIAHALVSRSKNIGSAILAVCIMTSMLSAFIENVATVLIVAPIALAISKKQGISPVPFLIGLAVSSNLQGTATLIGDPPSMILAGYMGLNFNQFFVLNGKPGIFFAVQVGAVISFGILYLFYRQHRDPVIPTLKPTVRSWFPTAIILLMILLLAVSSVIDPNFSYFGGIICMTLGIICIPWLIRNKSRSVGELLMRLDFDTVIFLASIFILVGSLSEAGLMNDIALLVQRFLGDNRFVIYTFFVWFSVLISAFVDNVPYITAMLPVAKIIAENLGTSPYLFVFGLLVGACLGGNVTPVGASANVVSVSILKREGYHVNLGQFARIGLPFTIGATAGGYLFLWLIWR
jgi:Na+/H+ antiporter NhaD/arsenite permease-like protein